MQSLKDGTLKNQMKFMQTFYRGAGGEALTAKSPPFIPVIIPR
jgi:hypothetical protein